MGAMLVDLEILAANAMALAPGIEKLKLQALVAIAERLELGNKQELVKLNELAKTAYQEED